MVRGTALRSKLTKLAQSGVKNRSELAKRFRVSVSTVTRLLPAHLKRTGKYTTGPSIRLTPGEKALIEGGVLGDGRLARSPKGSAFLFSNNNKDLVVWVSERLRRLVVRGKARYAQTSRLTFYKPGRSYRFQTATLGNLNELWRRWYQSAPKDTLRTQSWRHYRKTIPQDFRLSPLSGLLWYIGDGSLVKKSTKERSQVVRFATHDLPRSGLVRILRPQLAKILCSEAEEIRINRDRRSRYKQYGYEIYLPSRYVPRWLRYIGKCPVPSYRYKWCYKKGVRKMWLKDELDLLMKYWGRVEHKQICRHLGVSYEQARYAAQKRCGIRRGYSESGKPLWPRVSLEKQLEREALKSRLRGRYCP